MRLDSRAASTIRRPSTMLCECGLFHVNVLSGLASEDRGQRVPMVGRRANEHVELGDRRGPWRDWRGMAAGGLRLPLLATLTAAGMAVESGSQMCVIYFGKIDQRAQKLLSTTVYAHHRDADRLPIGFLSRFGGADRSSRRGRRVVGPVDNVPNAAVATVAAPTSRNVRRRTRRISGDSWNEIWEGLICRSALRST